MQEVVDYIIVLEMDILYRCKNPLTSYKHCAQERTWMKTSRQDPGCSSMSFMTAYYETLTDGTSMSSTRKITVHKQEKR